MTEYTNKPFLEEVTWGEVREAVRKVNPELADVIDRMSPSNHFTLYRAGYPFGRVIIKEGIVYYPTPEGSLVPITDQRISPKIREDLNYAGSFPVGLTLLGGTELFVKPGDGIIPFALMKPGKIFALWRALDPDPFFSYHAGGAWHMVSGARSLFMLPKITDSSSYKKLCRARGIKLPLPRRLGDHGLVFAQMSQHKNFPCPWQSELLFFTAKWFKRRDDVDWLRFHHFLLEEAWNASQFWRNKFLFDFMWDSFVKELNRKNMNTKPYIVDMVKHLITIAVGAIPGFSPMIDDKSAPISGFQKDFLEIYGLKNFSPTILAPEYFNQFENYPRPVYWSLQFPSYIESIPKPRTSNSVFEDLSQIQSLLEEFTGAVHKGKVKGVAGTPIESCIKETKIDFFHSDINTDCKIRPARELTKEDPALMVKCAKKQNNKFSEISPFIRGCVRFSKYDSIKKWPS